MSKIFFTSDTHFGHANIIIYCKRPFLLGGDLDSSLKWTNKYVARLRVKQMDEALISNWNATVSPEDDVYHLGDFSLSYDGCIKYLRQLNFKNLYFIWGNHDRDMLVLHNNLKFYPDLNKKVHFLGDMSEISINGQGIVLNHYAMRVWNKSHRFAWHLYGHSHGTLPDDPKSLSIDVGVDCHGLKPISYEEVAELMSKKTYTPIDHHGS